jgi:hypothetical protein
VRGTKVEAPRSKEGEGARSDSHKDVSDSVASVARYLSFQKGDQLEFYQAPKVEEFALNKKTGFLLPENPSALINLDSIQSTNQAALLNFFE